MDQLLTTQEAAEFLHVSTSTVYRYVSRNEIPIIRKGFGLRFQKSDLDEWLLKDKRISPTPPLEQREFLTSTIAFDMSIPGGKGDMANAKSSRLTFAINGETIPGTIYQRNFKNGNRWCYNFQIPKGKRVRKVAKLAQSKEEAILALQNSIQEEFDREYSIKRQQEKIKFGDFAEKYLTVYAQTNKVSWITDRSCIKYMKNFFGDKYLVELTSEDIEKFKKEKLKTGVQKSTVNRYLAILRKMFNLAKEWGNFPEDKKIRIQLLNEGDNRKERILTEDEEQRLMKTSSKRVKSVVFFALNTGMRLREILNIKWSQIDLDAGYIRVENTKSGRNRLVGINSPLLQKLQKLRSKNTQSPYVYTNPGTKKPYGDMRNGFQGACKRADIKGLRFHDLRHTFASRLVERGIDLITVKDLLGHSTVRMTERYTHSSQLSKRKAVEILAQTPAEKVNNPEAASRIRHVEELERWRARQDSNLRPSDS
ncbi:tyrosine-type recombinase/integrase [Acidobacteriota bacterium]